MQTHKKLVVAATSLVAIAGAPAAIAATSGGAAASATTAPAVQYNNGSPYTTQSAPPAHKQWPKFCGGEHWFHFRHNGGWLAFKYEPIAGSGSASLSGSTTAGAATASATVGTTGTSTTPTSQRPVVPAFGPHHPKFIACAPFHKHTQSAPVNGTSTSPISGTVAASGSQSS